MFNKLNEAKNKYGNNPNYFVDERDANVYQIVNINGKKWFTDDLKYNGVPYTESNISKNVGKGLFYNNINVPNLSLCPNGWHLPNIDEFNSLPDSYFMEYTNFKGYIDFDGKGF
ncbi:MAG: FISUMP domain-containing protein [Mariniphaga sp.]